MTLKIQYGTLEKTYPLFKPSSVQCADEIAKDRLNSSNEAKKLRDKGLYTANTALYTSEEGDSVLYFSKGKIAKEKNPILRNIHETFHEYGYVPPKTHIDDVVRSTNSGETRRFLLSRLNLHENNKRWCFFNIDTKKYDEELSEEQRFFAQMVFGEGDDFMVYMDFLDSEGIGKASIHVLHPSYVKILVKSPRAVGLVCTFERIELSSFYALTSEGGYGGLRGVPKDLQN